MKFFLTTLFRQRRLLSSISNFDVVSKYYNVPSEVSLVETIRSIDQIKSDIEERRSKTNGGLTKAIHDKLRFSWTYHSNAIEGSRLNLGDTIFFLQEGLTVGGKPLKDFVDAKNHSVAIDYLKDVVQDQTPIDCHLLRSINALLLKGVDYIAAQDMFGKPVQKKLKPGEYKTEPNYVIQPDGTIHEYVEPHLVEGELMALCRWINDSKHHPIMTASIAHYNMVRIHPFQDGNGRGARLLMNLVLMKKGYIPAIIEVEKRKEYLTGLKEADRGNLVYFTKFIAESVLKTQEDVIAEIDKYMSNLQHVKRPKL